MAVELKEAKSTAKKFQIEWYDEYPSWENWVLRVTGRDDLFVCLACEKINVCGLSQIKRHAVQKRHIENMIKKNMPLDEIAYPTTSDNDTFRFNDRVKAAELKVAAFFAQHHIPFKNSKELLLLFQEIGKESDVLQSMTLGKTKVRNIITKVLCPYETERVSEDLKRHRFSVFVDETTDSTNEKKMTLITRHVDSKSLCIQDNLLHLINLDAKDCSADKIFHAFNNEMNRREIPVSNVIGLSCDNASVMIGKHDSFKTRLLNISPKLVTMPCICHSSALAASNACKSLPNECTIFIKKIVSFINGSTKRYAIFKEFQQSFEDNTKNLVKYAETQQQLEKIKETEELLIIMENIEIKAYLYFLEHVLRRFNTFNTLFQSKETKIHLLKNVQEIFFYFSCKHIQGVSLTAAYRRFVLVDYSAQEDALSVTIVLSAIQDVFLPFVRNARFSRNENLLPIETINIGSNCAGYLETMLKEKKMTESQVKTIRQNCLSFLIKASEEIRDRFPIFDNFLENLNIFEKDKALFDQDREASSFQLLQLCRRLGTFSENTIIKEWESLYAKESCDVKKYWSKLEFDDMWKAICSAQHENKEIRYPQLRKLLNLVRSLPHSNAEAERCFSMLPDIKSKKRNRLVHDIVNATCVIKYALRRSKETPISMNITKKHLQLMKNDLYQSHDAKPRSSLNVYAYNESDDDIDYE
ncbi:zinc finger protein 862-like [Prorops nasuta]|uniref:zinc finger protein 862-like n=1 Tax=Prorops nasuta TaxID=863751 RepID=UPI0034CFB3C1